MNIKSHPSFILMSLVGEVVLSGCGANTDVSSISNASEATGGNIPAGGASGSASGTSQTGGALPNKSAITGGMTTVGSASVASSQGGTAPIAVGGSASGGGLPTGGTSTGVMTTASTGGALVPIGGSASTGGSAGIAGDTALGGVPGVGGASASYHAKALDASSSHACAVLNDGSIGCWGSNATGQLGDGTTSPSSSTPLAVATISNATSVALGRYHSCAVLDDGTMACWGAGYQGPLVSGTSTSLVPVPVPGISNAIAASASDYTTCALLSSGRVQCWGLNRYGLLGRGADDERFYGEVPIDIYGVTDSIAVSLGVTHACVVLVTGSVKCWGRNQYFELGNGSSTQYAPVTSNVSPSVAVAAGNGFTCVVLQGGTVQCWGHNQVGQVGKATTNESEPYPLTVGNISNAASISAGDTFACARISDGTVSCWGENLYGQLGAGNAYVSRGTSVSVQNIADCTQLASRGTYTCGLLGSGSIKCWGARESSEFGISWSSSVASTVSGF